MNNKILTVFLSPAHLSSSAFQIANTNKSIFEHIFSTRCSNAISFGLLFNILTETEQKGWEKKRNKKIIKAAIVLYYWRKKNVKS